MYETRSNMYKLIRYWFSLKVLNRIKGLLQFKCCRCDKFTFTKDIYSSLKPKLSLFFVGLRFTSCSINVSRNVFNQCFLFHYDFLFIKINIVQFKLTSFLNLFSKQYIEILLNSTL